MYFRAILYELLWFLSGSTNTKFLKEHDISIWDAWANKDGDLGPIYGFQWRSWQGYDGNKIDQVSDVINEIKTNPNSRRLVVSSWNVADLPRMALHPCHLLFQFYVNDNKLSCQLYQRSADVFLGLPFNIASYSLLTIMIAKVCNLQAYEFIHTLGDAHLYKNHIEQAKKLVKREPRPLPTIEITKKTNSVFNFEYEDFVLHNYSFHPSLKGEIAV